MEVNSKPHASTAFTSAEKAVGTRQIGGCLGPVLGVDFWISENLLQLLKIEKDFSVFQPVLMTQPSQLLLFDKAHY
jgi:hypothetical protein